MSDKSVKPNIVEEVIEEGTSYFGGAHSSGGGSVYGGAGGGGAGSFNWNSSVGAKTKAGNPSPSFRHTTAGVPSVDELTGIVQQEEEEMHKAPPRKPFPLETIQDDLAQAFIQLGQAETKMKNCIKYNTALEALKDKKKTLEFLQKKIHAIREMIQEMGMEIDRINLSNN